jgi:hypothetical protein
VSTSGVFTAPSRRHEGAAGRGWLLAPVSESGAQAAVLKRASMYRRLLAAGDVVAAIAAIGFALRVGAGAPLTPRLVVVFPALVLAAKLNGLYDRDELVLRKTTLDEAPALFQVATLFTLAIWGLGGALAGSPINPSDAFVLWIALFVMLLVGPTWSRTWTWITPYRWRPRRRRPPTWPSYGACCAGWTCTASWWRRIRSRQARRSI